MGELPVAEGLHVCHDLIIAAFISLWQLDRGKTKETLLKQWDEAPPPPPPTSSPPPLPCFQIQWTNILFWALRAKRLLRFVSQSFQSPRGGYGSQGRRSCRYVVERASSRCLFPLPKGFSMQGTEGNVNGENIQKQHAHSTANVRVFLFLSFCLFSLFSFSFPTL